MNDNTGGECTKLGLHTASTSAHSNIGFTHTAVTCGDNDNDLVSIRIIRDWNLRVSTLTAPSASTMRFGANMLFSPCQNVLAVPGWGSDQRAKLYRYNGNSQNDFYYGGSSYGHAKDGPNGAVDVLFSNDRVCFLTLNGPYLNAIKAANGAVKDMDYDGAMTSDIYCAEYVPHVYNHHHDPQCQQGCSASQQFPDASFTCLTCNLASDHPLRLGHTTFQVSENGNAFALSGSKRDPLHVVVYANPTHDEVFTPMYDFRGPCNTKVHDVQWEPGVGGVAAGGSLTAYAGDTVRLHWTNGYADNLWRAQIGAGQALQ